MTTTTDIARRNGNSTAQQPGTLAIYAGQTEWTPMQDAALTQLGIKDASDGDKAVFLHQCQRTGLDPFARQIYMIGRPEKKSEKRNGAWVDTWTTKWTIQTGIDGFRVNRARAERQAGVRGTLGRSIFYDGNGEEYKVWFRPEAPAACEITYTVKDANGETPYTSVLRYSEYVQLKDNKPIAQWASKPAHMLEKCTEADVYRKAFPQDFSGVYLDDAMPAPDPDAPPVQPPQQRQRLTDGQIRERRQALTATAETVTPDPSPAPAAPAAAAPAPPPPSAQGAGEALPPLPGEEEITAPVPGGEAREAAASKAGSPGPGRPDEDDDDSPTSGKHRALVGVVQQHFKRLGYGDGRRGERLDKAARIARTSNLLTLNDLDNEELSVVADTLARCKNDSALDALLNSGDKPQAGTAGGEASDGS